MNERSTAAALPVREIVLPEHHINWAELIFQLKIEEVLILKLLYLPQPKSLTFTEVERRLRKLNVCRKTLRARIRRLQASGLLETVNSYGLFIYPKQGIERHVYELIRKCNHRFSI